MRLSNAHSKLCCLVFTAHLKIWIEFFLNKKFFPNNVFLGDFFPLMTLEGPKHLAKFILSDPSGQEAKYLLK
jgi:hypothetical protein